MADKIQYTTVSNPAEVLQILDLQKENLPDALSLETMKSQGFVTVRHELAVLQRMNEAAPAVIAKDGDRVIGYALAMPRKFAPDVPVLLPMFEMLNDLSWREKSLRNNPRWFVMGQICIADGYRGMGIFDGLYLKMKEVYRPQYDFTVTEVAERNTRSIRAHERVGFQTLHVYYDVTTGVKWRVIVLSFDHSSFSKNTL